MLSSFVKFMLASEKKNSKVILSYSVNQPKQQTIDATDTKGCNTHQFHSYCTDDLLWLCDWSPSAQAASAADCPRTAALNPCPPLETEESCRPESDCKKKTFFFNEQTKTDFIV